MPSSPADNSSVSVDGRLVEQLQACFFAWFKENQQRFEQALVIVERTESMIRMAFSGTTPAVTARLTQHELVAETDGDCLISFDLPSGNLGYTCSLIYPLYAKVHTSLEAAWVSQFERFLNWANRRKD